MKTPRHQTEKCKEYMRTWRDNNREKLNEYFREYRKKNKERLSIYGRNYRAENITATRAAKRKYKLTHKEKCAASERKRVKERFRNDVQYKLRILAGCASQRMVKAGWTKRHKSAQLIGCTWGQLKAHIESQFKPGMSWQNHSKFGWHIDHIRPLMSFDLTRPDQMAAAMHYTNLQPLWWRENIIKGGKWEPQAVQINGPPAPITKEEVDEVKK